MAGILEPGTLFAGRYQIVRRLAAGGMGAVYETVHLETGRRRALKVMHPHIFQSDEMRDRFKLEARIAAHIESEHIVDVSDAGVDDTTQTPFLVMELLRGEDLRSLLKRTGPLPPATVLTYLQQVALALERTHAAGIVHRDLKPENLFLTQRDDGTARIKILDFGVAKVVAESATADGATRSVGTPVYMAPEQLRTSVKLTPAADIYAFGMMAFTLLAGSAYWAAEAKASGDVIALALQVVQGPKESAVKRAAALGVTLPAAFDPWLARATDPEPARRFRSATEAVRALAEVFAPAAHPAAWGSAPGHTSERYPSALAAIPPAPPAAAPAGPVAPAHMQPPTVPAAPVPGFAGAPWMSPSAQDRSSVPDGGMPDRTGASMGSALTLPTGPRRQPTTLVAVIVGATTLFLGVAAWQAFRVHSGGTEAPEPATPGSEPAAAATATASVSGSTAASPPPPEEEPSFSGEPAVPASAAAPPAVGASASPASSQAPRAGAGGAAKPVQTGTATAPKGKATRTPSAGATGLFSRD